MTFLVDLVATLARVVGGGVAAFFKKRKEDAEDERLVEIGKWVVQCYELPTRERQLIAATMHQLGYGELSPQKRMDILQIMNETAKQRVVLRLMSILPEKAMGLIEETHRMSTNGKMPESIDPAKNPQYLEILFSKHVHSYAQIVHEEVSAHIQEMMAYQRSQGGC